jgi:hypothetical protein
MTQVGPQNASDAAQSPGALPAAAAARRAWLPPSLRAAQSLAAVAHSFGDGIVRRLLEPHVRLSRRGDSTGRRRGLATSARRTGIDRGSMPELPALHDRDLTVGDASEPPMRVWGAAPHAPPAPPRLQALDSVARHAPSVPRPRVTAEPSTVADRFAAAPPTMSRAVTPTSSPPRAATSPASDELPRRPPTAAERPDEPGTAALRRVDPSGPARSAPRDSPEIDASPPPVVMQRRDRAGPMEVRRPAVERASERTQAADRGPRELARTAVDEHGRTVVVIEPEPRTTGPARGTVPIAAPAPSPRESADAPPSARAIEALIERTMRPTPMPGLEFRLLRSVPRDDEEPARRDADEPSARAPRRPAAPPPAAPPLNIDAVADKVYRLLERRQRLERERKGRV